MLLAGPPVSGPILASILMIAATEEKVAQGIVLLLLYSIGLGIPFLLSSLALHRFITVFNRFKNISGSLRSLPDFFLMIVGVLIFTNWLSVLPRLCQSAVYEALRWLRRNCLTAFDSAGCCTTGGNRGLLCRYPRVAGPPFFLSTGRT